MATSSEILTQVLGSAADVQQVSRLSRGQVYRLAKNEQLETVRVGRRLLFKMDSVRRLLEMDGK